MRLPGSLRYALPLLAATGLGACTDPGGPADAGDGDGRLFSFAILSDLHVGEGYADYGAPGYDDSGGEEDELTETLRAAVASINAAVAEHDIAFVAVLGDLTGSGERSELVRCREILDGLDVPYFPLLGNHDVWPYTADEEAAAPNGDVVFDEVFGDAIDAAGALFDDFQGYGDSVPNPERGGETLFIDYAFGYRGRRFLALDLNTREHAARDEPGIGPQADLHDFEGGTLPWLGDQLDRSSSLGAGAVIAFAHHPPMEAVPVDFGLSEEEHEALDAVIRTGDRSEAFFGFFAGHHHTTYDMEDYAGQHIVVVAATKDGDPPRLVQVFPDGRLDYETRL